MNQLQASHLQRMEKSALRNLLLSLAFIACSEYLQLRAKVADILQQLRSQ